jgi:hypothetical protein
LDRGRGRSLRARRRAHVSPVITPGQARCFFADLLARRSGSRENTADLFAVTFQTACNWHDGFSTPTGDKVLTAMRLWPEEFIQAEEI